MAFARRVRIQLDSGLDQGEEIRQGSTLTNPEVSLTDREIEILELVANRMSNREIASRLVISEHTVKNHLKNILGKLHVRNRREAVAYATSRGWLKDLRNRFRR